MGCGHAPPWVLASQVQPFLAIDPVGLLVVDQPAFASQQNMDAARPIANARGSNFPNALPLGTIVTRVGTIKVRRLPQLNDSRGTTDTDRYAPIRKLASSRLLAGFTAFFG